MRAAPKLQLQSTKPSWEPSSSTANQPHHISARVSACGSFD